VITTLSDEEDLSTLTYSKSGGSHRKQQLEEYKHGCKTETSLCVCNKQINE